MDIADLDIKSANGNNFDEKIRLLKEAIKKNLYKKQKIIKITNNVYQVNPGLYKQQLLIKCNYASIVII